MKTPEEKVRDFLTTRILEGGEKIERAVSAGPEETYRAIDELIGRLEDAKFSIMLAGIAAAVMGPGPDCGNPDCLVHGRRDEARTDPNAN